MIGSTVAAVLDVIVIDCQGRPAAVVTGAGVELAAQIAVLEADHPIRRWVACKAFFAGDVLAGRLHGPYNDRRAEHFARCVLIDDDHLAAVLAADPDISDAALAEHFAVPIEQLAEKRLDINALYATEHDRH